MYFLNIKKFAINVISKIDYDFQALKNNSTEEKYLPTYSSMINSNPKILSNCFF